MLDDDLVIGNHPGTFEGSIGGWIKYNCATGEFSSVSDENKSKTDGEAWHFELVTYDEMIRRVFVTIDENIVELEVAE